MSSPWRVFIVIVVLFTLVSNLGVRAQTSGKVVVASNLQLLSIGEVTDGGHVTWTLTGPQATQLRQKILFMFDQAAGIPRGFTFERQPTGSTGANLNSGVIESAEATTYLTYVDSDMEGGPRNLEGTPFRYVTITHVDLEERDRPAEQSSGGLVGTNAASSTNLEIRFIFNGRSTSAQLTFSQADESLAQALHHLFTFDTGVEDLSRSGCPPACYPYPPRNGFQIVGPPDPATRNYSWAPGRFLWAGGNITNPDPTLAWNVTAYRGNESYATFYSEDGFVENAVDLRYASSANLTFEHTGSAAPGDNLTVQASADRVTWTTLPDMAGNLAVPVRNYTILGTSVYDLDAYASHWVSGQWVPGQRVYLRLNFTATSGNPSGYGYFVRNMHIDAPSQFEGTIDFRHIDVVVGFLSFRDFNSPYVRPHLVRTPVGEVLFYNAVYEAGALPPDTARYATFDFVENPQVLFVLLILAVWLIGFFQDRAYDAYRTRHPATMRAGARKVRWLRWTGRIVIILLFVFYFFPTALVGAGLVVGGGPYWVFAIGALLGVSGFSTFWYRRLAKMLPAEPAVGAGEIPSSELLPPPPPAPEEGAPRLICGHCDHDIEDAATAFVCECGEAYHPEHAAERGTCAKCGRPLGAPPPPEKHMLSVQCPTCDEVNLVQEGTDLGAAKCSACNVILKEVARGYNYLLIAEEPHAVYEWFNSVVRKDVPGLCMSTTFPEKLRREYGLPEVELYWISDTNPGPRTLDPRRLDFEIMRAMRNFIKDNKGGAMVLDGIEYLVVENSFDRVLKFIKKVNDLASVHDATMFVPLTPNGLGPEEMTLLRKEFDKVETPPKKGTSPPPSA